MTTLGRRPVHAYDGIEHSYRFPHPDCLLCEITEIKKAVVALLDTWEMSADSLGPEWVAIAERMKDIARAVHYQESSRP